jgi:hypothetical protein
MTCPLIEAALLALMGAALAVLALFLAATDRSNR